MFCALTMASASVSVDRAELQRAAELAAEERERYAMHAASRIAQRMFLFDVRLPDHGEPITYERMYTMRHNALVESHESMATVLRLLRRGRVSRAMQVLDDELGSVASEESEEESLDDDEPVEAPVQAPVQAIEDLQQSLLAQITQQAPAAAPQAFSGRSFRLED